MYCSNCGKEIGEGTQFCPNCGGAQPVGQGTPAPSNSQQYNVCAIVGFVLSLVSLFFNLYGVLPIAAVIVSAVGIKQAKESGENGTGLAIAGVVIGAINLIISIIIIALFVSILSMLSFMG